MEKSSLLPTGLLRKPTFNLEDPLSFRVPWQLPGSEQTELEGARRHTQSFPIHPGNLPGTHRPSKAGKFQFHRQIVISPPTPPPTPLTLQTGYCHCWSSEEVGGGNPGPGSRYRARASCPSNPAGGPPGEHFTLLGLMYSGKKQGSA